MRSSALLRRSRLVPVLGCTAGAALMSFAAPATAQEIDFVTINVDDDAPLDPWVKAMGDLNDDGLMDLVVSAAQLSGEVVWYEAPLWTKHLVSSLGGWGTDGEIADLDGDGDLDIVISKWYEDTGIYWFENPGPRLADNPWQSHFIGGPRAHDISIADLDGDGDLDLVTRQQPPAGDEIVIWRQNSPLDWTSRDFVCPDGEGLGAVKIDGDVRPDVVIGARWYSTPSDIIDGTFTEHVYSVAWTHPECVVAAADLTGNGRLDVALSPSEGSSYHLSWFEQPDDPTQLWTENIIVNPVQFVHGLRLGDVDCDGDNDLVAAKMHQAEAPNWVRVYYHDSDEGSWTHQTLSIDGSHNIVLADIGGDGDLDVMGANWSGSYQPVQIWENLGPCGEPVCPHDIDADGTVGVTDLAQVILEWGSADSAADVTGDGIVDVSDLIAVIQNWGPCPAG